jgi:hypothetical protein
MLQIKYGCRTMNSHQNKNRKYSFSLCFFGLTERTGSGDISLFTGKLNNPHSEDLQ